MYVEFQGCFDCNIQLYSYGFSVSGFHLSATNYLYSFHQLITSFINHPRISLNNWVPQAWTPETDMLYIFFSSNKVPYLIQETSNCEHLLFSKSLENWYCGIIFESHNLILCLRPTGIVLSTINSFTIKIYCFVYIGYVPVVSASLLYMFTIKPQYK